jgi:hypothetical protein
MKKFVFLAGLAAAAFGVMKMLRSNEDTSFDADMPYEPQPQPQI